jgi:hypothetical protein
MIVSVDESGLLFWARPGPRWAARAFYGVKQLKSFGTGLGLRKYFLDSEICAQALSTKVCRRAKT